MTDDSLLDDETIVEARGQILAAYTKLNQKSELGHYDMLAKTRAARAYLQLGGDEENLENWNNG